jgi:ATPase subunit of ABC transporter with duplicated ATPase domains
VSCPSEAFCVAVDYQGNALEYPATKAELEAEQTAEEAAKKTKEEEQAAAKKAEEEAAAAKKHEEEAAGIKAHEAEAAAAKKREEEAAGIRTHEAEVATARKHQEEAEAKKQAEGSATANTSIKIVKLKATKRGVLITIDSSQAGTVVITGPGLKKIVKILTAGTHRVTLGLTSRGKSERKARKKIKVSVSLKVGGRIVGASKTIKLA